MTRTSLQRGRARAGAEWWTEIFIGEPVMLQRGRARAGANGFSRTCLNPNFAVLQRGRARAGAE